MQKKKNLESKCVTTSIGLPYIEYFSEFSYDFENNIFEKKSKLRWFS